MMPTAPKVAMSKPITKARVFMMSPFALPINQYTALLQYNPIINRSTISVYSDIKCKPSNPECLLHKYVHNFLYLKDLPCLTR